MKPVILDVDPGHDDAIAILMAAKSPQLQLLGVTTVAGNQTIEKTTENARKVAGLAGLTCPIVKGSARPLLREPLIAEMIHGESGLDGIELPETSLTISEWNVVDWLRTTILSAETPVTLLPVGPLTNIAIALLAYPEIKQNIQEIILMGGAIGRGNRTPSAEFNILADPEAAKIVFHSGIPTTMIGLDVTHQVIASRDVVQTIASFNNSISPFATAWLSFFNRGYQSFYHMDGAPLHDPCAVAAAIDPSILTTREMYVDVETQGALTYGRTVCDLIGVTGNKPNVRVATDIDTGRFWELLYDTLSRY